MAESTLIQGDCLEVMLSLAPASVDAIISDLPYGSTRCPWDAVIPFEPLWAAYRRVLKPSGVVVLTASGAFASLLTVSNLDWFRYRWVWDKVNRMSGHLNAKRQPLRVTEDVLVFAPGRHTYNPQMVQGEPYMARGGKSAIYGDYQSSVRDCSDGLRYPQDVIRIKADRRGTEGRVHPSQKPVELGEYLIRTYTNEGDTVLDGCMGSGSTGIACRNLGRHFIGIERDPNYFILARSRIEPPSYQAVAA